MSKALRVIVLNTDEEAASELRALLLSLDDVKIVAELDEPSMLQQAVDQFPAEVLLVHLDPSPHAIMQTIAPVIEARKDVIATVAMTEDRDAELVVRAMRLGMREFLWKPFPPEQLSEILKRLQRDSTGTSKRIGRLIPVVGTSGGVGATSFVTNLGVELAQIDDWKEDEGPVGRPRVAVVDLDFRFGQVSMFLDAQPSYTIADLCDTADHIEPQLIERVMVKHPSGVHVLAHPSNPEQAQRISAAQCASALGALLEHYDFVVVDGPARFDSTAQTVFDMTDIYVLVLQLVVPSVRNTDRILNELQRHGYNLDRVRLLCNRFGREAGFLDQADVEATLNRKLTWTLPDDWKTSATAVNVGASLLDYAPKSKLRLAYRQIARAIALATEISSPAEESGPPPELQKKGSIFSIFGGQKAATT